MSANVRNRRFLLGLCGEPKCLEPFVFAYQPTRRRGWNTLCRKHYRRYAREQYRAILERHEAHAAAAEE